MLCCQVLSPYMSVAPTLLPHFESQFPAIAHIDGSARCACSPGLPALISWLVAVYADVTALPGFRLSNASMSHGSTNCSRSVTRNGRNLAFVAIAKAPCNTYSAPFYFRNNLAPFYFRHLTASAVEAISGFALLCNTSFNTKGRPLINRVTAALELLVDATDLNYVLLDDFLFKKP